MQKIGLFLCVIMMGVLMVGCNRKEEHLKLISEIDFELKCISHEIEANRAVCLIDVSTHDVLSLRVEGVKGMINRPNQLTSKELRPNFNITLNTMNGEEVNEAIHTQTIVLNRPGISNLDKTIEFYDIITFSLIHEYYFDDEGVITEESTFVSSIGPIEQKYEFVDATKLSIIDYSNYIKDNKNLNYFSEYIHESYKSVYEKQVSVSELTNSDYVFNIESFDIEFSDGTEVSVSTHINIHDFSEWHVSPFYINTENSSHLTHSFEEETFYSVYLYEGWPLISVFSADDMKNIKPVDVNVEESKVDSSIEVVLDNSSGMGMKRGEVRLYQDDTFVKSQAFDNLEDGEHVTLEFNDLKRNQEYRVEVLPIFWGIPEYIEAFKTTEYFYLRS